MNKYLFFKWGVIILPLADSTSVLYSSEPVKLWYSLVTWIALLLALPVEQALSEQAANTTKLTKTKITRSWQKQIINKHTILTHILSQVNDFQNFMKIRQY